MYCFWPEPRRIAATRDTPYVAAGRRLDFGLLGNLQRVINLDAEIPHGTLQLGVAKQLLNRPQILRAFIDQGRLGPPH